MPTAQEGDDEPQDTTPLLAALVASDPEKARTTWPFQQNNPNADADAKRLAAAAVLRTMRASWSPPQLCFEMPLVSLHALVTALDSLVDRSPHLREGA